MKADQMDAVPDSIKIFTGSAINRSAAASDKRISTYFIR